MTRRKVIARYIQVLALYVASWFLVLLGVLAFLGGCRGVEPWLP